MEPRSVVVITHQALPDIDRSRNDEAVQERHLGDVARRSGDVAGLLERLHGTKHLVRGNNDAPATGDAAGWASVQDYVELTEDGHLLVLCHYAFRTWNGQHRRSINLHGHSYGRLKPMPRQFDVGVDPRG